MTNPSITTSAASTVGRDLLEAMVLELKMLPKPWPALNKHQQDDVIDRVRQRVITSVAQAVHIIASENRAVADATLKKVVFKGGITAEFELSKSCPTRHQLADAEGKLCLIVVADAADHLVDMDGVKGESDQRAMDLGHEYDPDSDGKGMPGEPQPGPGDDVSDARILGIGHDNQTAGSAQDEGPRDNLYDQAVSAVIAEQRASVSFIQRKLLIGYNQAARLLEQMEEAGIVSACDPLSGARTVLKGAEGAIE